jgi:O-antigen/teichoic acid export membrane protein
MKIALEPATNSTAFRTQRLRIAMLSSLGGKGVSIVSQLLALPLAIAALGIDRFGIYAMLVALLNWMNMAGVVITPGLTVQIVSASSVNDRNAEAREFTTAFLFALLVSMCMFISLQTLFHVVGIAQLFGMAVLPYRDEVEFGLQILAVSMSLSVVLSVVEGAQAGYQNQYVNNLLGTLGSVLSIIAIVVVVRQRPTIPSLILAIYGAPLAARVLNMLHLFWHRRYLLPRCGHFSMKALRTMLATGSAFLLTLFGTFCYQSFSVYWVGRELGSAAAAQMSVMMLVLTLSGSMLIVVTQPLWPAIQDAVSRDDFAWVHRAYWRVLRSLIPYIALAAFALALSGEYILSFWLKSGLRIDLTTRVLWGLYFFIVAWEHINYTVLMGLSRFWFASIRFSIGALVMLVSSVILCRLSGIDGIFVALCLGPLSLSAWLFPIEIRRLLARHRNVAAAASLQGRNRRKT